MGQARVVTGVGARLPGAANAAVTIGVFDGVHRAHERLIRAAVRQARTLRAKSIAVTFDPDPHAVLDPAHPPALLMPLDARVRRMAALGLDCIWVIPFTKTFARLSAGDFLRRVLLRRVRPAALIVGEDFAFGRGRGGGLDLLRATGRARGVRIIAVKQVRYRGEPVSSSRIRRALAAGHLAEAAALLGRRPSLYGVVVRGAGRGRRLGFPTANLRLTSSALPPQGVYAVRLRDPARGRRWHGVMNLGVRPTFGAGPLTCEVHVPGFSGTLLGRRLDAELLARLRGERCFSSIAALQRQVQRDLARARRVFRTTR
jgi:riboflavin kinase/FMN adenylyltransferase